MLSWLADAEDELASIRQDSGNPDPDTLHDQLNRVKALSSDVLNQAPLMEDVTKKGHELTHSLSGLAADRGQVGDVTENICSSNCEAHRKFELF